MQVRRTGKFENMPVKAELAECLTLLFAVMPSLEFVASASRRIDHDQDGIVEGICGVEVFDGEQKLGSIGFVRQYTKNGYEDVYRIFSRKIVKSRGDRNIKNTKNLKSALKLAKEFFVKDSPNQLFDRIYGNFKRSYIDLSRQATDTYKNICGSMYVKSFEYVLSIIDGEPQTIHPDILQVVNSDNFRQRRDNYRIAKSVGKALESCTGAIVYVDRESKLTLIDLDTKVFTKIESTYDLPKNYQEKYAMLKIMELNQPIEGVGVKMKLEIDEQKMECYYLNSGETIVTH
jgi:predicted transcriptional regulator with HTH domain